MFRKSLLLAHPDTLKIGDLIPIGPRQIPFVVVFVWESTPEISGSPSGAAAMPLYTVEAAS